jgi:vacuolar-type H+-ATPase subunit E/Vma4
MPPLTQRERSIAAKFRRFEKVKERAKALYEQADGILTELAQQMEGPKLTKMRAQLAELAKDRHTVRIDEDGRSLHLREASADEKGILGWGHGAVRQFDPKVVNP